MGTLCKTGKSRQSTRDAVAVLDLCLNKIVEIRGKKHKLVSNKGL
jgi:hypothetical protein